MRVYSQDTPNLVGGDGRATLFAVARLDAGAAVPEWAAGCFSLTRTREEMSIVCDQSSVPLEVTAERGFRMLMVEGPLDFSLTGVLASIAGALAGAGVSLFAISTFDTDYVLVREESLGAAVEALRGAGWEI